MSRLFIKIFLSFWVAMVLIITTASWVNTRLFEIYGISDISEERRLRMASQVKATADSIRQYGLTRSALSQVPPEIRRLVRVFDSDGKLVFGRRVPGFLEGRQAIRQKAISVPGLESVEVTAPDGREYLVVGIALRPNRLLSTSRRGAATRLGVAILVSALICWLLALYLTRPVRQLRKATNRLATGQMAFRFGHHFRYPSDEIGDLGRDFDQMADRLQQLLESQKRLMRDVSHELRSPLARLQIAAGLARRDGNPEISPYLDRIEKETERLDHLIEQILELSRSASALSTMSKQPLDLVELLTELVKDAQFEYQDRVSIKFAPNMQQLTVPGDRMLLSSALENVLRNALSHSPDGSTVTLKITTESDKNAVVTISDQGPGVAADQIGQIFDPFYQVEAARGHEGFGLGLAIVDQVVQAHRGSIEAKNGDNGGLVITMTLPSNGHE